MIYPNPRRALALGLSSLLSFAGLLLPEAALATPPPASASDPVPDPGKSTATTDDTSAIAVNPANLAFLSEPEARFGLAWTGSPSTLPNRGASLAAGLPIGPFATGLRLDLFSPPAGAPIPFDASYHWLRWGIAYGNPIASIGTTIGWGLSESRALNGYVSLTSGVTSRLFPWLSTSLLARDWNEPVSEGGVRIERSYALGLGLRPIGRRMIEAGVDLMFYEKSASIAGRATLGIDVPRVGRLRGDVAYYPERDRRFVATAGLDVNIDRLQVSGGAVFGDAVTRAGTGFYVGAAFRGLREPGVQLPAHFVRMRINDTPGPRGNTRLVRKLWRLAADPEIDGVVLQLRAEPASSLAHAEEVADAIRGLRAAKKQVLCHLEDASSRSLFVCSQADRIAMNPAGGLRFAGIASQYYYFGGALRKLGVRADFVRIGAHKLAAEQYTNITGSDVAQIDHQELVDQFEQIFLDEVGRGRHIAPADLKQRIAHGPFLASEAKREGLIDILAFQDEIDRVLREMTGRKVRLTDDERTPRAPDRWGPVPKVAMVYLSGDMVDGESQSIPFVGIKLAGSVTVARALRSAREDPSVKAVIFRIETGGGSSLAADVILREAIITARKKPLIVSMGSAAASGGYYAAVSGGTIFANRATVTGSIGIFYGKVDVVGLLDKLGVRVEQYRSSPRADAESFFRPFTDAERAELGVKVKQFYDLFIARVAEGRRLTPEAVDAVARGKVWTGAQALPRGLVDKIGGLREAFAEARRLGGLPDDAPVTELPEEDDSLLGQLLKLVGLTSAGVMPTATEIVPPAFLPIARLLSPFMVFDSNKPLARAEFSEEDGSDVEPPSARELDP
jgi:protease IV